MVFLSMLFLFDRIVFLFLQTQRPSDYKLFLEAKQDFFNDDYNINLLIIGDSHIADALDPRILDSMSTLKSYNLGVYHASPFENYYITLAALTQQKGKLDYVVLGTNPEMFDRSLSKGRYTPLIINGALIRLFQLTLFSEEGFDKSTLFLTVQEQYLFTHVFNQLCGKTYKPTRAIVNVFHGFLEFHNQMEDIQWSGYSLKPERIKFNSEQIVFFKKTIELLQEEGIKVIIVNTPIWFEKSLALRQAGKLDEFESLVKDISLKYHIPLFNPGHDLLKDDLINSDFLNAEHLNYGGAVKFSTLFRRTYFNKDPSI